MAALFESVILKDCWCVVNRLQLYFALVETSTAEWVARPELHQESVNIRQSRIVWSAAAERSGDAALAFGEAARPAAHGRLIQPKRCRRSQTRSATALHRNAGSPNTHLDRKEDS